MEQLVNAEQTYDLINLREDLKAPVIAFGHCAITGEWGKCVIIDMGDICFQEPDADNGVEVTDGLVNFTKWKPVIFTTKLSVSINGLKKLLAWGEQQANPIPILTPNLVYAWHVLYQDNTTLTQFYTEDDEEKENLYKLIEQDKVKQLSIFSRSQEDLPVYSFSCIDGKFYQTGKELHTFYEGEYMVGSELVYCRKVSHTWGSTAVDEEQLRNIESAATTILQIFGWKVGGLPAMLNDDEAPGCIIAVDERGNWRPYHYK